MDKDYDIKIRDDIFDDDYMEDAPFGNNRRIDSEDETEMPVRRRNGDYRNQKRNKKSNDFENSSRFPNEQNRRVKNKKRKRKRRRLGCFTFLLIVAAVVISLLVLISPPKKTVFLIAGTDAGGTRTDTLMLGVLNATASNSEITLISVPRDTLVSVSDNTYEKMCEEYPQPSGHGMKINEIYHFAGEKYGMEVLINELESKFDVDIDYYAKVNFDGLHALVDSIGGVSFYVPRDMDYEDPLQNLKIHLQEGEQVLDGSKAEQLLRYRAGYARADLERVEVQQNFMKTLVMQMATPSNVSKNFNAYLDFYNNHVDTNFKFSTIFKYAKCAFTLKSDSIKTYTMPGSTGTKFGRSGYLVDVEEFDELYGNLYK